MVESEGIIVATQMAMLATVLFTINHPIFFMKRSLLYRFGITKAALGKTDGKIEKSTPNNTATLAFWFITTILMIVPVFLTFRQVIVDGWDGTFWVQYLFHYILLILFLPFWSNWASVMYTWRNSYLPERLKESRKDNTGMVGGLIFLSVAGVFWTAIVLQFCIHFLIPFGDNVKTASDNQGSFWTAFSFYIASWIFFMLFIIWIFFTRGGLGGGLEGIRKAVKKARAKITSTTGDHSMYGSSHGKVW